MAANPRADLWRFRLLLVPTVLVVAVVAVRLWRDEARAVRARVQAAADAVSGRAGEGDLDRLARLAGLGKLLTADVVVEPEPGAGGIRGRDAVVGLASQLANAGGPQRVELSDLEVTFDDAKTHASVTAVARVTAAAPGAAAALDGDVVRLELVKDGGSWLIARVAREPALAR
jgi:hypothetical protein